MDYMQQLLALAQQGDEKAIASLLNQVTRKKGMTATVTRDDTCLQIVLMSEQVPHQSDSVQLIRQGMLHIKPTSIKSVWVHGQQSEQKSPAWSQLLELSEPSLPTPEPTPTAVDTDASLNVGQNQHKKRIRLLALGGIGSLFVIAAGGLFVKSQLNTSLASTPHTPTIVQLPASSPLPALNSPAGNSVPNAQPVNTPPGNLEPNSTPSPAEPTTATTLTIKAVGDTIPGSNFPKNELPSNPEIFFEDIKPYLQGADILFANFESTLTNYPRSSKNPGRGRVFAFRTPPAYANLLKEVGFNVLNVANNHSLDFFEPGFEDTFRNIEAAGINAVGKKNQILYLTVNNIDVAFIGFSFMTAQNYVNDLGAAKALVKEARKNAKIVVISVHMGAEGTPALHVKNQQEIFYGERRGNPVLFAHTMIDNGADLILGHSPHVPRAMELYKGKLIAYSLGNFLGYKTLSTSGEKGYSLILETKLNQQGNFVSAKIIPVYLDEDGIPHFDKQYRSVYLIRQLTKQDFPKTPLTIDNKGEISSSR